ncbi:MAG TPA: FHA domain-containing protein [Chthoniobacteraceae bacterium]|nr:FHA domain-containing protein [Chthoniobacteraceae bacterium]
MPKLTVSLPDGAETVHELTAELITIGRVEDNMIEIADISVSSRHAQLSKDDGDYVLRDLGSTNGTRINGHEAPEGEDIRLSDGDSIVFGKIAVHYGSEVPAPSRPLPAEEGVSAVPAAASVRPADFANASPFQTKKEGRDPKGMAIVAVAILALLAAGGVVAMVYQMQAPL